MTRSRTVLSLATIALAILAAAPTATADDSITRSFPFQPGERLEIDTALGHVELRHSEGNTANVTVTVEQGKLSDYLDISFSDFAGGLRVEGRKVGSDGWFSGWSGGRSPEIRFVVEAPERLDVDFNTGGGHIKLAEVEGKISLDTSGGHVFFADIEGTLTATTSGGHIKGGSVTGGGSVKTSGGHINMENSGANLDAKTSGGHISIGEVDGELDASTSGGHIKTGRVERSMTLSTSGGHVESQGCGADADVSSSGGNIILHGMAGHVKASTSGGNMSVTLASGNAAGADLSTGGGEIELEVPAGVGYQVDAQADGGLVEASLPDLRVRGVISDDRLQGTIGSGGNLLRLRTRDGDIKISVSHEM